MKKAFIVAAISVAVCAVSAWLLRPEPAPAAVIEMSDAGFSPRDISIKIGDRVEFRNVSSDGFFWPASNLHPTHELYPAFDPREPIAPGDIWSFTFKKRGEWSFHDHLRAEKRGTITVSE